MYASKEQMENFTIRHHQNKTVYCVQICFYVFKNLYCGTHLFCFFFLYYTLYLHYVSFFFFLSVPYFYSHIPTVHVRWSQHAARWYRIVGRLNLYPSRRAVIRAATWRPLCCLTNDTDKKKKKKLPSTAIIIIILRHIYIDTRNSNTVITVTGWHWEAR